MRGLWTGYHIKVATSDGNFDLETEWGVRGRDIPVEVSLVGDEWKATRVRDGQPITIVKVTKI